MKNVGLGLSKIFWRAEMLETTAEERYVLACILNDISSYWKICDKLEPSDFSLSINAYIYSSFRELMETDRKADIISILDNIDPQIRKIMDFETGGDTFNYLIAIKESPFSVENIEFYANKIKMNSIKRQLISVCKDMIERLPKLNLGSIETLIEYCEDNITRVASENLKEEKNLQIGKDIREILNLKETSARIPLGFYYLDSLLGGGVAPGQLMVVTARPKVGKSTLLWNWAIGMAKRGLNVLYLDTEMLRHEQQARLLSILSGIEEKKIINGLCNEVEQLKLEEAISIAERLPLYHMYIPDFTIESVVALAKKFKIQKNIQVLFFDYIKLPSRKDTSIAEWQELGYFTDALKNRIGGKLNIPVITAGQLNRLSVKAEDFDSDQIAGSDRILQLCNYLLMMKRLKREHGKANILLTMAYARDCEDNVNFYLHFQRPTLTIREVGATDEYKNVISQSIF